MGTAVFDTLRFARGLREAGVPEQQADRQAELMAEAFSAFADKLVTKDYFSEVLSARLKEQTAFLEQRMTERFAEQDGPIGLPDDESRAAPGHVALASGYVALGEIEVKAGEIIGHVGTFNPHLTHGKPVGLLDFGVIVSSPITPSSSCELSAPSDR